MYISFKSFFDKNDKSPMQALNNFMYSNYKTNEKIKGFIF